MGSELDKWQIETAERLASIERSIKYIEANLGQLPQSPYCIADFEEHHVRIVSLETFRASINRQVAFVSGVAAAIITAIPYLFEWMKHLGRG